MRILQLASLALVSGAMTAAACGSGDSRIAVRGDAGQAGDAGAHGVTDGRPSEQGGASTQSEAGGAGADGGGLGGMLAAGGVPAVGGAPAVGGVPAVLEAGAGGQGGAVNESVVDIGFDDSDTLPANLDPGTAVLTPSQGYEPLGPDGNQFGSTFLRGPTGTVITLTLTELPPHQTLSLSLLFAAIDSLDGEGTFSGWRLFQDHAGRRDHLSRVVRQRD